MAITCHNCGWENFSGAERCFRCQAPLHLDPRTLVVYPPRARKKQRVRRPQWWSAVRLTRVRDAFASERRVLAGLVRDFLDATGRAAGPLLETGPWMLRYTLAGLIPGVPQFMQRRHRAGYGWLAAGILCCILGILVWQSRIDATFVRLVGWMRALLLTWYMGPFPTIAQILILGGMGCMVASAYDAVLCDMRRRAGTERISFRQRIGGLIFVVSVLTTVYLIVTAGVTRYLRNTMNLHTIIVVNSMPPWLQRGDRILVRLVYQRGDVVIWQGPSDGIGIERLIGLPGDTVVVHADGVHVNGRRVDTWMPPLHMRDAPLRFLASNHRLTEGKCAVYAEYPRLRMLAVRVIRCASILGVPIYRYAPPERRRWFP